MWKAWKPVQKLLLLDEDTSATNFMGTGIPLCSRLSAGKKEPITPFLERARDLYGECGISTILVAGSSGAFFHIADTIIQMDSYQVLDITKKVKDLCADYPLPPASVPVFSMPDFKKSNDCPCSQKRFL